MMRRLSEAVLQEQRKARRLAVRGVPTFVANGMPLPRELGRKRRLQVLPRSSRRRFRVSPKRGFDSLDPLQPAPRLDFWEYIRSNNPLFTHKVMPCRVQSV
jgi:hypothetical protein